MEPILEASLYIALATTAYAYGTIIYDIYMKDKEK